MAATKPGVRTFSCLLCNYPVGWVAAGGLVDGVTVAVALL